MSSTEPGGLPEQLEDLLHDLNQAEIQPITPENAIALYLDSRTDLKPSSRDTHRAALGFFERWCEQEGIETLDELNGRLLHEHRIWRRTEATSKVDALAKKSEKTHQDIVRGFIRFCESIDAVAPNLHSKVQSPSLSKGEATRDQFVEAERASEIASLLATYEYASIRHAIWTLLTASGVRIGSLIALDIGDCHLDAEPPHLELRHRPQSGTPLKNGDDAERLIAISDRTHRVLSDYIDINREDVVDDAGREPLLTSRQGRLSTSTVRKYVYMVTRPCYLGVDCPHGRSEAECEATQNDTASKCPSSRSPHAVRRGYITHELNAGVDRSYISGRCDVSEEVIKEHYDARDQREQMLVRRRALDEAHRDVSSYGGR